MVPSTSISLSSRPTWCPTHVSISPWPPTLPSSLLRRPTTSSSPLLRSPTPALSLPTSSSSAIPVTESTWPAACCTEEMLSPRTSTPPSPPSRPSVPSSSSTGAQLVSRSASTTSHPPSSPVAILPRSSVPCACCPIPPPSPRPGLVLTISSILCTPSVPSSTGTSERVWKRESSPRPVRIWLPWRRTTKRSESTPSRERVKRKARSIKHSTSCFLFSDLIHSVLKFSSCLNKTSTVH